MRKMQMVEIWGNNGWAAGSTHRLNRDQTVKVVRMAAMCNICQISKTLGLIICRTSNWLSQLSRRAQDAPLGVNRKPLTQRYGLMLPGSSILRTEWWSSNVPALFINFSAQYRPKSIEWILAVQAVAVYSGRTSRQQIWESEPVQRFTHVFESSVRRNQRLQSFNHLLCLQTHVDLSRLFHGSCTTHINQTRHQPSCLEGWLVPNSTQRHPISSKRPRSSRWRTSRQNRSSSS